jgi:hypothetical protein
VARGLITVLCLFVLFVGGAGAFTTLPRGAAAVSSASAQQRRLIGSYRLVTRIETPRRIIAAGSLSIDTYNRSTGAITGHGFDEYEGAPALMTGTVRGSRVTMRVVNRYGVASDRGRVYPDGTIRGTVTARAGKVTQRGSWTLTPFELVVRKVGLSVAHLGRQTTTVSWGAELQNVSTSRDASDLRVKVEALSKTGRGLSDRLGPLIPPHLRVIPAGKTIYVGGSSSFGSALQIARIRVSVTHVASRPKKRHVLPPVTDVRIDRANRRVIGTLTNPYRTRMSSDDFTPSVVFYDRSGRIIGGDDLVPIVGTSQWITPGDHATVENTIPNEISLARIARARVTALAR